ncbi:MAG: glycosyltransferase family 4 protein [archaeon]
MNICFVNPTTILKRPIAQLINKLKKDHKVALLIPYKQGKKLDDSMYYSRMKGVKVYSYPAKGLKGVAQEWPRPTDDTFKKHLDHIFENYDIIHMWTHFYLTNFKILMKKCCKKKPKLILTMDTLPGYSFSAGKKFDFAFKIYTNLFGWFIYGVPDAITIYCKSLVPFAKKSHMNMKKVKVLGTGIDLKESQGKNIRKKLGVKEDEIMILFIGIMLYDRKGLDTAINTIKKLEDQKIKFFMVGGGPGLAKAKALVKKLKLQKKVIFTGYRKDVPDFCQSADIFFFPSRGEGLAGVIMEAMANSLPVVSSRISCTTDLVEDGKTGFLCSMEDTDEYAEKIKKLIKSKKLRKTLGEAGKKRIQDYEWSKVLKEYEKLYKKVLKA